MVAAETASLGLDGLQRYLGFWGTQACQIAVAGHETDVLGDVDLGFASNHQCRTSMISDVLLALESAAWGLSLAFISSP